MRGMLRHWGMTTGYSKRRIGFVPAACVLVGVVGGADAPARAWQALPAISGSSTVQKVAIFGNDDRVPLPAKFKDLQEKIGLLFNLRARTVCTAFCVAKDMIATAGH